jgi:hypothetical protein
MNTDTDAEQRKTWCYQVPQLVLFILYFTLGIDVFLIKYMLLLSVPSALVMQHRFVECGPKQHDKRSNISIFFYIHDMFRQTISAITRRYHSNIEGKMRQRPPLDITVQPEIIRLVYKRINNKIFRK